MNHKDQLFQDSEYLFNIQLFNIKLERVTLRGHWKLPQSEVMDVKLGRSINNLFNQYHFPFSMNKMNHFFHQVHNNQV